MFSVVLGKMLFFRDVCNYGDKTKGAFSASAESKSQLSERLQRPLRAAGLTC
jgi:hypothetical protein